jgi:hypothetical protein
MVVDIAPQQQLTEVFTTNRSHHRSSSSSSTHRRSSTTTNNTSSLVSNNNNSNTMTNGHGLLSVELGRKAEQILGHATAFLGCSRQTSMDFHGQNAPRLNITASTSTISSRSNNIPNMTSSTSVNNLTTITSSQSVTPISSDISNGKNKRLVTVEHLVPFILQLVAAPKFMKLPEMISRHRSNPKSNENLMESHEMKFVLHGESAVKLSDDDENEDDDDDDDDNDDDDINNNNNNTNHSHTVLTEITDNKITNNSKNQNNSNDNHPTHSYENQM